MTPKELLQSVKARFSVLLVNDEAQLTSLLFQALGTYQDKAGAYTSIDSVNPNSTTAVPVDYLEKITCRDRFGSYVEVSISMQSDGNFFTFKAKGNQYPLTLIYLQNFRAVNLDEYQLPPEAIGLLSDYLYILIKTHNSAREMRVAVAGSLDTSHIPTEAELETRKTELEMTMSDQFILPTMSVR